MYFGDSWVIVWSVQSDGELQTGIECSLTRRSVDYVPAMPNHGSAS